jgi:hypothetical protein
LAQGVLGQIELLDQAPIALGLLQRVEILALEVLDQRGRHRLPIPEIAHHDRDFVQRHELRRPPAAFAADDLVPAVAARLGAHQDGLQDAVFPDGVGQFLERGLLHGAARLERSGLQHLDRQGADRGIGGAGRGHGRGRFAEERREAAAEPGAFAGGRHAAGLFARFGRSRRSISAASLT